jgi:hypothetical protein
MIISHNYIEEVRFLDTFLTSILSRHNKNSNINLVNTSKKVWAVVWVVIVVMILILLVSVRELSDKK